MPTKMPVGIFGAMRAVAGPARRAVFEFLGSDRYSRYALNDLDHKLRDRINLKGGFFVEAGANDGLAQSNSYCFEKFCGWRGLLIEPVPELVARCRANRPRAIVAHTALVSDPTVKSLRMKSLNLMSKVADTFGSAEEERQYVALAKSVQLIDDSEGDDSEDVEVPACTLSSLLDELNVPHIDLFSLDVESYEMEVLKGLDLARHHPTYFLIETKTPEAVSEYLGDRYELLDRLTHHDYLFHLKT